jgi:hypothetical protein
LESTKCSILKMRFEKRVLKLFGRKKWIEKNETEQMLQWENDSQLATGIIDGFAELEYEMSQLLPGTEDGFIDPYDAPLWMDSS